MACVGGSAGPGRRRPRGLGAVERGSAWSGPGPRGASPRAGRLWYGTGSAPAPCWCLPARGAPVGLPAGSLPASAVHPRARGECGPKPHHAFDMVGASPRVGGVLPPPLARRRPGRLIPACGGSTAWAPARPAPTGSSPRAGGVRWTVFPGTVDGRSIPARGASTSVAHPIWQSAAAHPRARGGVGPHTSISSAFPVHPPRTGDSALPFRSMRFATGPSRLIPPFRAPSPPSPSLPPCPPRPPPAASPAGRPRRPTPSSGRAAA